jgi:hypothetical protein
VHSHIAYGGGGGVCRVACAVGSTAATGVCAAAACVGTSGTACVPAVSSCTVGGSAAGAICTELCDVDWGDLFGFGSTPEQPTPPIDLGQNDSEQTSFGTLTQTQPDDPPPPSSGDTGSGDTGSGDTGGSDSGSGDTGGSDGGGAGRPL